MRIFFIFIFLICYLHVSCQERVDLSVQDTVFILFDRKQTNMHYADSLRYKYPEIYGKAPLDSVSISYGYTYENKTMASFLYYGRPTKELKREEKHFNKKPYHPVIKIVDLSYLSNRTILGFDYFRGKQAKDFIKYFFEGGNKHPLKNKFVYLIDVDEIVGGKVKLRSVIFMNREY